MKVACAAYDRALCGLYLRYAHSFGILPFLEQELSSTRAMAAQLTHSQTEQLHITPRGQANGCFTPVLSCTLQFTSSDHALNIGCSDFQSNLTSWAKTTLSVNTEITAVSPAPATAANWSAAALPPK
ncbi:MAG: hypothetical protein ACSLEN_03260 [Candidatus Malihini olakiniferum]